MRISELSTSSGVSIPTIKFYLREALLAPGRPTAVNQADYDEGHLHRLRLIRALSEVGGLRLREIRAVLAAIDDERLPLHDLLGVAQYALEPGGDAGPLSAAPDPTDGAIVDAALGKLAWQVNPDAPARQTLGRALASLRELGWEVSAQDLARYGNAVSDLAASEVDSLPSDMPRGDTVERLVVGTVMFEVILSAMRRLAQEHHSAARFGGAD
jgi:DNA-binding transcriptional MerR regulator